MDVETMRATYCSVVFEAREVAFRASLKAPPSLITLDGMRMGGATLILQMLTIAHPQGQLYMDQPAIHIDSIAGVWSSTVSSVMVCTRF